LPFRLGKNACHGQVKQELGFKQMGIQNAETFLRRH